MGTSSGTRVTSCSPRMATGSRRSGPGAQAAWLGRGVWARAARPAASRSPSEAGGGAGLEGRFRVAGISRRPELVALLGELDVAARPRVGRRAAQRPPLREPVLEVGEHDRARDAPLLA